MKPRATTLCSLSLLSVVRGGFQRWKDGPTIIFEPGAVQSERTEKRDCGVSFLLKRKKT